MQAIFDKSHEIIKKLNTDCLKIAIEEYRKKSREPQNIRPQEHQKNLQKQQKERF
mgnify:CR=1 FL=1